MSKETVIDNIEANLPSDFAGDVIDHILSSNKYYDPAVFITLPGMGKRRIVEFIVHNKSVQKKFFKNVDIVFLLCVNSSKGFLRKLKEKVRSAIKANRRVILLLDGVEHLLEDEDMMQKLRALYLEHWKHLTVASFSSDVKSFITDQNYSALSRNEILGTSIFFVGPMSRRDMRALYEKFAERYDLDPKTRVVERILDLSGGHTIYLHTILRGLVTKAVSEDDLWHVPRLVSRLLPLRYQFYEMMEKFGVRLADKFRNGTYFGDYYLERLGVFDESGKMFSEIFEYLVGEFQSGHVNWENAQYRRVMTEQEYKVYGILKSVGGDIVSRIDISKVLWGRAYADKYSDWSIDKVIQGIREKLTKENEPLSVHTKRGEGFWLS